MSPCGCLQGLRVRENHNPVNAYFHLVSQFEHRVRLSKVFDKVMDGLKLMQTANQLCQRHASSATYLPCSVSTEENISIESNQLPDHHFPIFLAVQIHIFHGHLQSQKKYYPDPRDEYHKANTLGIQKAIGKKKIVVYASPCLLQVLSVKEDLNIVLC